MNTTETRSTRIAVFIDFDNVEIGVKSTIGTQFDIGLVLEAIKERGEIVTKIAYSDWKRAGDYSRLLTQHAIRMVQRNVTPGGDKNGADITMALDALEMAFTHDHINAFVIVGGDSDFISLVEKLKQYGRKVIVVGGRQFTSVTMQRNCHEFIAYENLLGSRAPRSERGRQPAAATTEIAKALPLVRRALKVLSEREVTPQLGLLKSTLLQLDSTFSERDYGASSFRDFMEKVAAAGVVALRHAGRSMLVEATEEFLTGGEDLGPVPAAPQGAIEAEGAAVAQGSPRGDDEDEDDDVLPASPMSIQDGIKAVQQALSGATRWPMYVRQAKQFLKNNIEGFDERKYGFASVVDLLRAAGKEGVLRIERDRQGAIRVFPGAGLTQPTASDAVAQMAGDEGSADTEGVVDAETTTVSDGLVEAEPVSESPVVEGEISSDAPFEITAQDVVASLQLDDDDLTEEEAALDRAAAAAAAAMLEGKKRKPAGRGRGPAPKPVVTSTRTPSARRPARKSTRRKAD